MHRDQLNQHRTATYVMPRWKAVYVSVNKAACTSLKWLVADLQGESAEHFHTSLSREVSRTMTIHRRQLWRHTPMLHELSDDQLAEISPENGWFVFAAVRHPGARMWSAWQSKLLLREPFWVDQFGEEPWFPGIPRTTEDIVSGWLRFAAAMREQPDHRIMRNRHLAPQAEMLALGRMPYSGVYETRRIPQLLEDLERHLRTQGWKGEKLVLPRANETPLKPIPSLFPAPVAETFRELYAEDYEAFDYDDAVPDKLDPSDAYSDAEIGEVARLVERAERISDLALLARRYRRQASEARDAAGVPQRNGGSANGHAPGAIRKLAWRARRRLKRALPAR
jgi:hypothetical protein